MAKYPRKFKFMSDPAHGWLKVPVELLKRLNIAHKITSFSYQRFPHAYLEEDCDMPIFIDAYEKQFGHGPECTATHTDRSSKIRNYPYFDKHTYMPTQGE